MLSNRVLRNGEWFRFTEKKRERLQDFLTTLLDISPEHVSQMNCTSPLPCELGQYREFGDKLAYSLDDTIELTITAGYMEAAVADDWLTRCRLRLNLVHESFIGNKCLRACCYVMAFCHVRALPLELWWSIFSSAGAVYKFVHMAPRHLFIVFACCRSNHTFLFLPL